MPPILSGAGSAVPTDPSSVAVTPTLYALPTGDFSAVIVAQRGCAWLDIPEPNGVSIGCLEV
ncbi:hypothetical protein LCGC14_2965430, partial [marine sediment metagenome]